MLRPARTCPRVNRLLLMDPVSFSAASPSLPVAYNQFMLTATQSFTTQTCHVMSYTSKAISGIHLTAYKFELCCGIHCHACDAYQTGKFICPPLVCRVYSSVRGFCAVDTKQEAIRHAKPTRQNRHLSKLVTCRLSDRTGISKVSHLQAL